MCRTAQRPVKRMFLKSPLFWSPTWRIKRRSGRRSRTQTLLSTQRQRTTVWRSCTSDLLAHIYPLLPSRGPAGASHAPGHTGMPHSTGHEDCLRLRLVLLFRCYFLFVRLFVQPVPVSCWLTIMNQCALDLGSFQLLPLYCCRTRVEIHHSSCVCVDMSALVLMESMHRSTFYFPVLKSPVLIRH